MVAGDVERGEVVGEPVEHRLVRRGGRVGVVAAAGVVEEGVVDTVERAQLVVQPRRVECGARRPPGVALTRSSSPA